MAASHSLHLPRRADRARDEVTPSEPDAATTHEGGPTKLGGRFLMAGLVFTATLWVVSLVQLIRLPVQGPLYTPGESVIWTALAISSAIATFLLGVWKVHRT